VNRRLLHVTTTDISLKLLLGPQLRAFRDAGWEVLAASAPGPDVAEIESWGIRHIALQHATRSFALSRDLRAMNELYQVIRRVKPALVHTHNPKPGIYGRAAARAAGVPVVNTVHGLYATPQDRLARRAVVYGLERLAAACSAAELVQNPEDLATLARLGVPARRLVQLGNGIDLRRFHRGAVSAADHQAARHEMGAAPGDVVVGVVGRLVWEKGYREVFDAATRLRRRVANVRVVVIGPSDPDKADGIGPDALARAQEGGVRWLGRRDDLVRLYAAMDVYVLASYREGFPRSAMEAAAMGLPIVATDIRGCRQVVDAGRTGLLVPVRDAAALTDAIQRLAEAPDLRRAMGHAASEKAGRDFDQQRVIDVTLAVYEAALGLGRPAVAA
jgi:glycosyltransferase involved in cell wall biosynthesis